MADLPKTIKIHELPEISEINDSDIFIIEDNSKTYKITGKNLIDCIKNNDDINNYFVHQSIINNNNGIAPLDENKKVPVENLPVGITSGTLFDGGRGKALEDSWDAHLLDNNDPHGSNAYTDQKIADLINGAPTTLDTLKEIADAMSENEEVVEALESAIGNKANQNDLTNHIDDSTVHVTEEEKNAWNNMVSGGTGISSLTDLGVTATAVELNYMDGVTSDVQIQLDGKVNKRDNGYAYNDLTSYYSSSTPTYYRIKFPDSITTTWTMLNIEISVRQNYSSGTGGKIFINALHSNSTTEWTIKASTFGNFTTDVKVYASDGKYIYIGGCTSYSTISIDKILVGDAATKVDISSTSIDVVSELPTTYQTATMYYGLNSENYTTYAAKASHTQAASTITNGTLGGKVVANSSAVSTLGDKQVRNIYVGETALESGVSALPTGDIYIKYK